MTNTAVAAIANIDKSASDSNAACSPPLINIQHSMQKKETRIKFAAAASAEDLRIRTQLQLEHYSKEPNQRMSLLILCLGCLFSVRESL